MHVYEEDILPGDPFACERRANRLGLRISTFLPRANNGHADAGHMGVVDGEGADVAEIGVRSILMLS